MEYSLCTKPTDIVTVQKEIFNVQIEFNSVDRFEIFENSKIYLNVKLTGTRQNVVSLK